MYSLIDVDAMYSSAHQVFEPAWRSRPVIVLSNHTGIIVAASYAAKALGIEKFKPYFEVAELCRQHSVIVVVSNFALYSDLSQKLMQVISRFAPSNYVYSVDEIFQDYDKTIMDTRDFSSHGAMIRRTVWKECRLPVSVGFGETLTLTKAASHAAKRLGYNGVCVLTDPTETEWVLSQMPTNKVWGIGSRISKRLAGIGINTALELSKFNPKEARKMFSVEVERTVLELQGVRAKYWDDIKAPKKQIFSTRSEPLRIKTLAGLLEELSTHAAIASRKAREQGSLCQVMICFAGTSRFETNPVSYKALHEFEYPTADVNQITHAATELGKKLFRKEVPFFKVGVGLIELVDGRHEQIDMFNTKPNNDRLMSVFDSINQRFGKNSVYLGAQGHTERFCGEANMITPQYTTRWRDLPRVKC